MNTYFGFESLKHIKAAVVTIGTFDGFHEGHHQLLQRIKQVAHDNQAESLVVTYEPAPVSGPNLLINSLKERLRSFEQCGVEHVLVIPFEAHYCLAEGKLSILKGLQTKVDVERLLYGFDQECMAALEALPAREFGREKSFVFERFDQYLDTIPVTTDKIRASLCQGQILQANRWLGYRYNLIGQIASHRISFDKVHKAVVASILPENPGQLIPEVGRYTVEVIHNRRLYQGELNVLESSLRDRILPLSIYDFDEPVINESVHVTFISDVQPVHSIQS